MAEKTPLKKREFVFTETENKCVNCGDDAMSENNDLCYPCYSKTLYNYPTKDGAIHHFQFADELGQMRNNHKPIMITRSAGPKKEPQMHSRTDLDNETLIKIYESGPQTDQIKEVINFLKNNK